VVCSFCACGPVIDVPKGSLAKSAQSDSSGSTASDEQMDSHLLQPGFLPPSQRNVLQGEETESSSESGAEDETRELPNLREQNQLRPQSSLSSRRYRTPVGGSLAMSPPPMFMVSGVPPTQPLSGFETPSAFAERSSLSVPSSADPTTSSYVGQYSELAGGHGSPAHVYPSHPQYRTGGIPIPAQPYSDPSHPASRLALERAIENVQSHLAALHERLDSLEALHRSNFSLPTARSSPSWGATRSRTPADGQGEMHVWDLDDMGMWSLVLSPMTRGIKTLQRATTFLARNESRSPTLIVVRRLFLDISFLLFVLAMVRAIWIRSGVRRREIRFALRVLWRAILGTNRKPRQMADKGV
jgi:hypothetical protein